MKKTVLVAVSICLLLVMAFASPALAASKGAVKADMVVHTDSGTADMPAGTVVGSVVLNTTGSGYLIVVVNLDDASMAGNVYDSLVHINGVKILDQVAEDILRVNKRGQATANYKVDLRALPEDLIAADATEISVKVVVRPTFDPNTTPCYVNGPVWPTDIVVPLK